ncbi:MAG: hypothetical protein EON87_05395 [Brevundimonas sp.]|nr:MAG: hypothetical protein EON87_05395 [Brevundimonas sp.]
MEMRAVAIDFETANEQRASPCSIGLAWINDGVIESVEHHYIRPPGMRFASFNIKFHGICPEMVEDAGEFPEVFGALIPRLKGRTVLAHNASFDISVVRNTCDVYGMPYPEFDYLCTVKLAQATWADLPSGKLNHVCDHLGIKFKHHDAAQDAYACAELTLAAAKAKNAKRILDLPGLTGVTLGKLYADSYSPCSSAPGSYGYRPAPHAPMPKPTASPQATESGPLKGLNLVFSGELERFTRTEARCLSEQAGAAVSSSVSRKTDYLVAGPGAGSKMADAQKHGVVILTEDEWLALIGG